MRDIEVVLREKESQLEALNWEIETLRVAADILKDDGRAEVVPLRIVPEGAAERSATGLETQGVVMSDESSILSPSAKIADVQHAHISDLRVLLDKANAREEQLAAMVKMVMEERYFRPTVTGSPRDNRTTTALPAEHLSDVEAFDEKDDQAQSDEQAALQKEMQDGLNELLTEHEEAHKE